MKYLGETMKGGKKERAQNLENNLSSFVDEVSSLVGSDGARLPVAGVMPFSLHMDFALACARKILCFPATAAGPARLWAWSKRNIRTLFLGPGNLRHQDCRKLWEELSLKPVVSRKRVAVIHSAHKLSLPAANSLLKISEETPSTGALIFLLEENVLIPTLRSRLRLFQFRGSVDPEPGGEAIPPSVHEFVKWVGKTRKLESKVLAAEIQDWVGFFLGKGDHCRAAGLDTIRLMAEKGKLTTPMAQDLVLVSLEGEVRLEELLGDNW